VTRSFLAALALSFRRRKGALASRIQGVRKRQARSLMTRPVLNFCRTC
jgi:hypothetical protein